MNGNPPSENTRGRSSPLFLITHEFYPVSGGIATFTEEIAKASASLGFDVEVWAQSASNAVVEKKWPFRMRRLPLKGTHGIACQIRLACALIAGRRQLRHATVYLPEPGPMLTMMLLQFFPSFRPRRLVLTFHGSEILRFAGSPVRRWLAGRLIRHATRVSTLTTYTQELLVARFPEAADKIKLTPGALRSDFAHGLPSFPQSKDKIIILTVGRLHPRKGQILTLRALQALPGELRRRIEYWIVGGRSKDGYENLLRARAEAEPKVEVRFLGNVADEELSQIYDRSDIFAMTSVHQGYSIEGFGLVYLEAAAHGLPIVAHNVGGVPEAVRDGITGLLVPPDRAEDLTAAFARLILDGGLRQKLGEAGREWARRNCWKESATTLFASAEAPE